MTDKIEQATAEILEVCQGLLDDRIPLIEGCRRLASLRHEIGMSESAAFNTFLAVDSETDHLPFGEVRHLCSPEWLATVDRQIDDATRLYGECVRQAAGALLESLQTQENTR